MKKAKEETKVTLYQPSDAELVAKSIAMLRSEINCYQADWECDSFFGDNSAEHLAEIVKMHHQLDSLLKLKV